MQAIGKHFALYISILYPSEPKLFLSNGPQNNLLDGSRLSDIRSISVLQDDMCENGTLIQYDVILVVSSNN
jgi:hypothetical protein